MFLPSILTHLLLLHLAAADGTGLIGWGRHMYRPACAFACRAVLKDCRLVCTPTERAVNYGSAHSPVWTPPGCFISDDAFLRTLAVCIDTYCFAVVDGQKPEIGMVEDYWASHIATGTLGDYRWSPTLTYKEALREGRRDEEGMRMGGNGSVTGGGNGSGNGNVTEGGHVHGRREVKVSPLPVIKARQPLNVTSFVLEADWRRQYNGMNTFETNEKGHSNASIAILLVALLLPIPLSFLRLIPSVSHSHIWSRVNAILTHPAIIKTHHRVSFLGILLPTRGQMLYIILLSLLNTVLLVVPYRHDSPNSIYATRHEMLLATVGNRAGSMAMGNAAALFVFSARNNALLTLTDWSHATFVLLHRVLGYWAVLHTVLHSVMLFAYYVLYGHWEFEAARLYWQWGVVGTVAAGGLLLASLPVVRRRVYEVFLGMHQLLAILFLVGYYYHIWFLYTYNWGYEIWVWICVAVWALDRLWRVARAAMNGVRTARVVAVGASGTTPEYLRIDVDDVKAAGVVYLYFPTLRKWMFWENHPFSVASSSVVATTAAVQDVEKDAAKQPAKETQTERNPEDTSSTSSRQQQQGSKGRITIVAQIRGGVTARLAARLAGSNSLSLPVLVEGSYRSASHSELENCFSLVCIAGGVGVTAVLPVLHDSATMSRRRAILAWGVREVSLVEALGPELAQLRELGVEVQTSVGRRMNMRAVLEREVGGEGEGPVGVLVCGPPGMADEARAVVCEMGRKGKKAVVFVDETFSW